MAISFYKVLGDDEKASKVEIKKSYRSLQMNLHPDRNTSSQDVIIMPQQ